VVVRFVIFTANPSAWAAVISPSFVSVLVHSFLSGHAGQPNKANGRYRLTAEASLLAFVLPVPSQSGHGVTCGPYIGCSTISCPVPSQNEQGLSLVPSEAAFLVCLSSVMESILSRCAGLTYHVFGCCLSPIKVADSTLFAAVPARRKIADTFSFTAAGTGFEKRAIPAD